MDTATKRAEQRRRGQERRWWRTVAIVVAAMTVMASCSVIAGSSGDGLALDADEVCRADTDGAIETIVWMETGTDDEAVASVERALTADASVTAHTFVDADDTYAEFVEFYADSPEVIGLVEPEQLPVSFRVTFVDLASAEQAGTTLEAIDGVDQHDLANLSAESVEACRRQVEACNDGDPTAVKIWMEPSASQSAIDAVEQAIAASPFIGSYVYLDREATYADFSESFADQPEVVALVEPEQLPTRFEVTVALDDAIPAVAEVGRSFETMAGVEGVDLPAVDCARLGR